MTLRAGACTVDLHPAIGGSVGRFTWHHPDGRHIDLLRPMHAHALAERQSEGASCFPLLPFSNRIRDSRFSFEGEEIQLSRNTSGPHVEHGHGWQRPWSTLARSETAATFGMVHNPAADSTWPYAYSAELGFSLDADGLTITISARNLDRRPMPIGFGLHPYFPRTPMCRLEADVDGFWETDQDVLPLRHRAIPRDYDLRPGLAMNDVVVDNVFTGFQGKATITWPEYRTRLTLHASPLLRFLTVYVPDAATSASEVAAGSIPYFCAEPVSNITDAVNLARDSRHIDTGLITLAPDAEVAAHLNLAPEAI